MKSKASTVYTVPNVLPPAGIVEPVPIMLPNDGSNSNTYKGTQILDESVLELARGDKLSVQYKRHVIDPKVVALSLRYKKNVTDDKLNVVEEVITSDDKNLPLADSKTEVIIDSCDSFLCKDTAEVFDNADSETPLNSSEDKLEEDKPEYSTNDTVFTYYYVQGSSLDVINGRYLACGSMFDAPKYINVRGWVLFRHPLLEIPELGIYADGCYDAIKGTSVTALLNTRAMIAFQELIDPKLRDKVKEGGIQFKRRFGELSRSGSRNVNTDQILSM